MLLRWIEESAHGWSVHAVSNFWKPGEEYSLSPEVRDQPGNKGNKEESRGSTTTKKAEVKKKTKITE